MAAEVDRLPAHRLHGRVTGVLGMTVEELGRDLTELDRLWIAAREGVLASFSEVKTYETIRKNHRARERAEEK